MSAERRWGECLHGAALYKHDHCCRQYISDAFVTKSRVHDTMVQCGHSPHLLRISHQRSILLSPHSIHAAHSVEQSNHPPKTKKQQTPAQLRLGVQFESLCKDNQKWPLSPFLDFRPSPRLPLCQPRAAYTHVIPPSTLHHRRIKLKPYALGIQHILPTVVINNESIHSPHNARLLPPRQRATPPLRIPLTHRLFL